MMPMIPEEAISRQGRQPAEGCTMLPLSLKHNRACRLNTGFVPALIQDRTALSNEIRRMLGGGFVLP